MFGVTVFIGNGMWGLLYQTEEKAQAAFDQLSSPTGSGTLIDDFGHQMRVNVNSLHGAVLEDLNKSKLAHCERALHQQRTQVKAAQMSEADPVIKAARAMTGPAIINPMGSNGRMY